MRLGQLEPLDQRAPDHLGPSWQIWLCAAAVIQSFQKLTWKAKIDGLRVFTWTTSFFFHQAIYFLDFRFFGTI